MIILPIPVSSCLNRIMNEGKLRQKYHSVWRLSDPGPRRPPWLLLPASSSQPHSTQRR